MKIRKGFASEYGRMRGDVEVDEADLARMVVEHQLPVELTASMTTIHAFRLQDTLCEWLMLVEAAKVLPEMAPKVQPARITYYRTVDEVRVELGLQPAYAAWLASEAGEAPAPE